ncbi:F0F1 ATP synthase subunit delta [Thiohalobacter thiocyanaticus]|nr:F0F1 ATP synthase subunit delta [Thiohalobacter thiocyanaticus]
MTIDWVTVSAQIVNFLILVWLLKRFLYQPVIRAMDRREQRVSNRLNEAQEREQAAEDRARQFEKKSESLDRRRDEILNQAREDAAREKKQMLEDARAEVAGTRRHWQQQANAEKEEFLANLRHAAAEAIQAIARKGLRDLADAELEERIVHTFIERLKSLDADSRKALAQTAEPVRIASAFELDSGLRSRLTRAIHEQLAEQVEVEYRRSPELLGGIQLARGGRRLGWNLADYMEELEERVETAFSPAESTREED